MSFGNPYETLGLAPGASVDEAKRAFRKLARQHHPDLHPDDPQATERFKAINAAYEAIRDGTADGNPFAGGGRRGGGPGPEYVDTVWLMAEYQLDWLLREALPALVAEHGMGHAFVLALAEAARLGELPQGGGNLWARLRVRRAFKQLHLRVEERRSWGRIISLQRSGADLLLILSPSALWSSGAREDDVLRELLRQALAMGLAAAAPQRLGLTHVPRAMEEAKVHDQRLFAGRWLWRGVWIAVALFAAFAIGSALLEG